MASRLIVADSSISVQKAVQMAFSEEGFEIYPINDGGLLLESIHQIEPDVILLSLSLPGKDGYEVSSYLKSTDKWKEVPLIFLKGAFETLDQAKIAGIAFDEVIQKPFDSERLVRLVKKVIEVKGITLPLPEEPFLDEGLIDDPNEEKRKSGKWERGGPFSGEQEDYVRAVIRGEVLRMEGRLAEKIKKKMMGGFPAADKPNAEGEKPED